MNLGRGHCTREKVPSEGMRCRAAWKIHVIISRRDEVRKFSNPLRLILVYFDFGDSEKLKVLQKSQWKASFRCLMLPGADAGGLKYFKENRQSKPREKQVLRLHSYNHALEIKHVVTSWSFTFPSSHIQRLMITMRVGHFHEQKPDENCPYWSLLCCVHKLLRRTHTWLAAL